MSLIQRIKEATAIIGLTAVLNTSSGCATTTLTVYGTFTGPIDGARLAYETNPLLIPVGIAGGLIVGPLIGLGDGIMRDFVFSLGGNLGKFSLEEERALSHPVCYFRRKIGYSDQDHLDSTQGN